MGTFYSLLIGPDLYRKISGPERVPHVAESWGGTCMSISRGGFDNFNDSYSGSLGIFSWDLLGLFYVSTSLAFGPVLFFYLYHRGWFNPNTTLAALQYTGILLIFAYGGRFVFFTLIQTNRFRFIGRVMDPTYREFIAVWQKARDSGSSRHSEVCTYFLYNLKN